MTATDVETRFWDKVAIAGVDDCWLWEAAKTRGGYGVFWLDGKTVHAHRYAWILANGEIPDDLWILHKCDQPACTNPKHLFLGDQQINMDDMCAKYRQATGDRSGSRLHPETRPRGEAHGRAKLTSKQVSDIRMLYATGTYSQSKLGSMFSISHAQISYIVNYKNWKEGVTTL